MKRPEHIVLVNVHFDPDTYGGATIVAGQVAKRLRRQGVKVTAIAAMVAPELPPYTVVRSHRDGIDCFRINLPPGSSHVQAHIDEHATRRFMQLVARLKPDLVHLHCLQGLGAGMLGDLKKSGIPIILSVHDFWWFCERQFMVKPDGSYCGQDPVDTAKCGGCVSNVANTRRRNDYLFDAIAKADLVTFPSSFAHGLSVRSGLPHKRGVIWENGVTTPGPGFFDAQRERRSQSPRLTFGFVGGPSAVKGWPLVRAAFKQLDQTDFDGVVVDGSLDGSWWRPAMLQGMQGQWQILPRYDQTAGIDKFFASIDVLLFLSQWREAFGLVVREAISRGVRVIQTAGGGAAEHRGPSRLLPIGAGPEELSTIIGEELKRPMEHPDPIPCRNFDDQTNELLSLIDTL